MINQDHENTISTNLQDYILLDQIGSGSYGKVYRALSKKNNKVYAAKVSLYAIDEITQELFQNISREINIISKLNHPTILNFINSTEENSVKGTPIYMAPEIWENGQYSKSSDVYAFSIVVYEILTLEKPFPDVDIYNLMHSIINRKRPEFNVKIPEVYKFLITRC